MIPLVRGNYHVHVDSCKIGIQLNFKVNQITYLQIYKTDQRGTYSTVFYHCHKDYQTARQVSP